MTPLGTIIPESIDYAEIARRPLDTEHCALIVIDIQEKLLPPIFEKERLLRNSQLLIRMAGVLKMPTLLSTQYSKGLGNTVPEVASLLPDTSPIAYVARIEEHLAAAEGLMEELRTRLEELGL